LSGVFIRGIKPEQVHLAFADITTIARGGIAGAKGTNIDLSQGKSVKVTETGNARMQVNPIDPCSSAFVPMR
jgi:hypothetical protein